MNYTLETETADGRDVETDLIVYTVPKKNGNLGQKHVPELPSGPLEYFDAEKSETQCFHEGKFSANRCLLAGIGDEDELEHADLTELGGQLLEAIENHEVEDAAIVFPLFLDHDRTMLSRELCSGLLLAGYEFDEYQHEDEPDEDADDEETELESLRLLVEDGRSRSTVEKGLERAKRISGAVELSRDLGNTPANELVPRDLAERAEQIEDEYENVSVDTWDQEDLIEDDMNLINAVGKGSENPPCLIKFHHEPDRPKGHVGLAGKGVTFDTGGISIKPSKKMDEMKYDMCGAAAVFGVVKAVAALDLPVEITALVPAAENMPGERSVKPGDIVTGYAGKSVEILNTDAEGRLCLADALGYASDELGDDLDMLIDFATLTGACITALGHEAAGLMGNDDELCEDLMSVGDRVQERVWQLPLWEDHSEQMDSDIADVKNMGGKAGAITAGAFLREFVNEDEVEQWAHLDIAGTGWGMKSLSYRPEGGTGFGVRLIVAFLRDRFTL